VFPDECYSAVPNESCHEGIRRGSLDHSTALWSPISPALLEDRVLWAHYVTLFGGTVSASPVRRAENVSLNVVRLVAASLVVIAHLRALLFVDFSASQSKNALTQVFYLLSSLGHPAVIVFFALSGYWVGGGVIRALGRGTFTWSGYLSARLTRLWLVLIPAVVLTQVLDRVGTALNSSSGIYSGDPAYHTVVPLGGAIQFLGIPETIGNAFFVQGLWVSTIGSNTPLWSLAYELWFYVMFPAILVFCSGRQTGRFRFVALLVLLCAIIVAGPKVLLLFPIWIAGAGLAWKQDPIGRWLKGLPTGVLWSMQVFCVSTTFASAAASSFLGSRLPGADYIIGVASLAMIASFVADDRGSRAALYPLSQAAKWSYSLYAFHLPILAIIVSIVVPWPEQRWQVSPMTLGMGFAVLSAVFLAAYALSLITEAQNEKVRSLFVSERPKGANGSEKPEKRRGHPAEEPSARGH
jgi:peptidoglycan/LPS O-acetylase OafA/YrhL